MARTEERISRSGRRPGRRGKAHASDPDAARRRSTTEIRIDLVFETDSLHGL
jgi:hypothetical protein